MPPRTGRGVRKLTKEVEKRVKKEDMKKVSKELATKSQKWINKVATEVTNRIRRT